MGVGVVSDELYPEGQARCRDCGDVWNYAPVRGRNRCGGCGLLPCHESASERRLRERAADLYDLVRRALGNPTSWVEWQREAIAVVDHIEGRKGT